MASQYNRKSRYENIYGRVVEQYRLPNGNLGAILQHPKSRQIYAVEIPIKETKGFLDQLLYSDGDYFQKAAPHMQYLLKPGYYASLTTRRSYSATKYATHLNYVRDKPYRNQRYGGQWNRRNYF